MPQQIFWIEGPGPGQLAIIARPRGGEWLADELAILKAQGLDVIVSLLTPGEMHELDLNDEQELAAQHGMQVLLFPIQDRQVPSSFAATQGFVQQLASLVAAGKYIGVHCRQSVGRSSLIVASMLVTMGLHAETAFSRIAAARGCAVPDTEEQRQWVQGFAAWVAFGGAG